jgi:hypothetical protein
VKGAVLGISDITPDSTPEESARADLQIILQTRVELKDGLPSKRYPVHLRTYIETAQSPNWGDFINSFKKTTEQLKAARILRMLSRGNIFNAIRVAYQGIMWKDLSIDLVAAALRQREFAKKITSSECAAIEHPLALSKACSRYHKFILLMNRENRARGVAFVPTLDIDLCWHTHQLSGHAYRKWCIKHLGVPVNHDDTVGKELLEDGLKETTKAWRMVYRESYTNEDGRAHSLSVTSLFGRRKSKGISSQGPKLTQNPRRI